MNGKSEYIAVAMVSLFVVGVFLFGVGFGLALGAAAW